jgi:plasmid stabilization system protein ParE
VFELEIIAEAREELRREIAYSKKVWGTDHSRSYAAAIRSRISRLRYKPYVCQLRNDILTGIRLLHYRGNCIIYTVIEEQRRVIVLAMIGCHQGINPRMIKNRKKSDGDS